MFWSNPVWPGSCTISHRRNRMSDFGRKNNESGTNVYAVIRAPRATGVEAILFAVDLSQREAIALVMAYAVYARQQIYWARDLFFVFVDGGATGMDAWLSQYHLVRHSALYADPLLEMGGVIIGGVVMKTDAMKASGNPYVLLEVNNINGQLPNLDLFNSVVRIAGKGVFALDPVVYGVYDKDMNGEDWYMLVPLRAMYTQAFVAIEGVHSVMGKYGVQAITVTVPSLANYSLRKSTRMLEAIARSLNNVLERFHQSYFLYILVSPDHFVSIAYFMPILGGVLLPLLIFVCFLCSCYVEFVFDAYREWINLNSFVLPRPLFVIHFIGVFTWWLCKTYFVVFTENAQADIIYLAFSLLMPWGLVIPLSDTEIRSLRFLLLLECSLACAAVALLNFSLALSFAIVVTPLLIKFTEDSKNRSHAVLRTALALASHPVGIYTLFMVYVHPFLMGHRKPFVLKPQTYLNVLFQLLKEHLIYGSHLLPLMLTLVMPIWNLILLLAIVTTKNIERKESEKEQQLSERELN
ncbi:Gaa1-like, GPI transamidase component [Dictyocaulus viviparus]|uniref:Gaa1-like, GPI transamidase component n=1 Tax=Dictyocaulus viviparus TaxID=29172 RepID=A0A0D8Y4B7_DICVI|nr:Gaa1-like, GPI transamidase component [Dictyocaulus viviparus]